MGGSRHDQHERSRGTYLVFHSREFVATWRHPRHTVSRKSSRLSRLPTTSPHPLLDEKCRWCVYATMGGLESILNGFGAPPLPSRGFSPRLGRFWGQNGHSLQLLKMAMAATQAPLLMTPSAQRSVSAPCWLRRTRSGALPRHPSASPLDEMRRRHARRSKQGLSLPLLAGPGQTATWARQRRPVARRENKV